MTRTVWILLTAPLLVLSVSLPAHSQQPNGAKPPAAISKDEEAIRKSASDFCQAFEKKDPKAIAALWAENGEYQDDAGKSLRGREAIEKEYTDFFQENHGRKIDIRVQSVRFPTPDVALEEGIIHETGTGKELPTTTRYRAVDARVDGQWKIVSCEETGNGQDHLDDLNWLVGKWKGGGKDEEMNLSFAWDDKLPILQAKLSKSAKGKPAESATLKIGYDPRREKLHSWHSEADGAHAHSLWTRDGSRWVLNSTGMTGDGKDTSAEYVITRIDNNNFTWRAIDRQYGDKKVPDMPPIKLTRQTDSK